MDDFGLSSGKGHARLRFGYERVVSRDVCRMPWRPYFSAARIERTT